MPSQCIGSSNTFIPVQETQQPNGLEILEFVKGNGMHYSTSDSKYW